MAALPTQQALPPVVQQPDSQFATLRNAGVAVVQRGQVLVTEGGETLKSGTLQVLRSGEDLLARATESITTSGKDFIKRLIDTLAWIITIIVGAATLGVTGFLVIMGMILTTPPVGRKFSILAGGVVAATVLIAGLVWFTFSQAEDLKREIESGIEGFHSNNCEQFQNDMAWY